MIKRFIKYIEKEKLFSKDDQLVVAVSGGMDSMALLDLLLEAGFNKLLVAHCNFQLRAEASDLDEKIVEEYCKKHDVPFYLKRFNMEDEMEHGHSLQMKARSLRYDWFDVLLEKHNSKHLLLAHHLIDNIETVLMNLFRGTGIRGVSGMRLVAENKIRPLLNFTRKEIQTYVKEHKVPYRDDQSNFTDEYLRNRIRNQLLPVIEELFPAYENNMSKSLNNLRAVDQSYAFLLAGLKESILSKDQDGSILISKEGLYNASSIESTLHAILYAKGFSRTQIMNIKESFNSIGASFHTDKLELFVERNHLRLREGIKKNEMNHVLNLSGKTEITEGYFQVEKVSYDHAMKIIQSGEKAKNIEYISLPNKESRLKIRNWKKGDYFHPLGMNGRKKIQDLFTDLKIENSLKKQVPILVNEDDEIIWVVSYRLDQRFKLDPSKNCFKISWQALSNSLL